MPLKWLSAKRWPQCVNSLWPSDAKWQQGSRSTLVQVMACCLMAPSHYLNQCWLIISKVQWHSSECNFTRDTSAISHWNKLENYLSKILFKSPRNQWVKRHFSSWTLPNRGNHTITPVPWRISLLAWHRSHDSLISDNQAICMLYGTCCLHLGWYKPSSSPQQWYPSWSGQLSRYVYNQQLEGNRPTWFNFNPSTDKWLHPL